MLQVLVGTENGVVGTLDITSHKYNTLLRSHSDSVNVVAFSAAENIVSGSSDGTIRIWDIETYQQLCAQYVAQQPATCAVK
jgi:WD40 repeat protein